MTELDLLKYILIGAGFLYLLFYGTWIFYTAFMHIKKYRKAIELNLPLVWKGIFPLFIVGLLMDVLFNLILGTIYYREPPKILGGKWIINEGEWLFTARCSRHMKGEGIQLARATRVCTYLLNPFDEGHCL